MSAQPERVRPVNHRARSRQAAAAANAARQRPKLDIASADCGLQRPEPRTTAKAKTTRPTTAHNRAQARSPGSAAPPEPLPPEPLPPEPLPRGLSQPESLSPGSLSPGP